MWCSIKKGQYRKVNKTGTYISFALPLSCAITNHAAQNIYTKGPLVLEYCTSVLLYLICSKNTLPVYTCVRKKTEMNHVHVIVERCVCTSASCTVSCTGKMCHAWIRFGLVKHRRLLPYQTKYTMANEERATVIHFEPPSGGAPIQHR